MWQVTACKISVSLSFLKWIKSEIIFYRISELMLPILIQRYVKNHFILIQFKNEKLTENFTGFQVPHFMIIYQFIKPYLDNKMSIFEEYDCIYLENSAIFYQGDNLRDFVFCFSEKRPPLKAAIYS